MLCDLNRTSVVRGRAEWAIAAQIDGRATVGELAGRSGLGLHDALEGVTWLLRSGLCTIGAGRPVLPLPRRVRDSGRPAVELLGARPDPRLLQQVLEGLKSLD